MKSQKIILLIFAKSIDGGTGTYVGDINKITSSYEKGQAHFEINTLVLEEPSYRHVYFKKVFFLRKKKFYKTRYIFSINNIYEFIKELYWYYKKRKEIKPDLILGIDIHCNLLISILNIFQKHGKIILSTHIDLESNIQQRSDRLLQITLNRLVCYFYNKADLLLFVSQQLAKSFIKTFKIVKAPSKVIYHGISKEKIIHKVKLNFEKKILITIARLVEQKDYKTLLDAFYILYKKIPEAELWIISNGAQNHELISYSKKLEVYKKIKFHGWVKNIYTYLDNSSIFVFSSKREGFGYVLLEAMARGKPIISTRTRFGPEEILDNGLCGKLVPVGEPGILAETMISLLTNKRAFIDYSEKSLKRVKFFSLEKMLKNYYSTFFGLVK